MTSGQESSDRARSAAPFPDIESLAGVFHPHAIEVQDFSHYALVIDLRSPAEYEDDHIPGAVRVDLPPEVPEPLAAPIGDEVPAATTATHEARAVQQLPDALTAAIANVKLDQAILVYCGQGGRVSQPVAQALRWRGWTVDVLPGGWINYRRWVQAGLEVLPRLVAFRVIACSLGTEALRVLRALRELGQQVVDVEGLAGWRHGALEPNQGAQPSQAWFESQLLESIRAMDPRTPVWVGDVDTGVGSVELPGAFTDALAIAPAANLAVGLAERVQRWREDEPVLTAESSEVVHAVAIKSHQPGGTVLEQWQHLATEGTTDLLLSRLLGEGIDPFYAAEVADRAARRHALPALTADSLAPGALVETVRAWLQGTLSHPAPG
jgi:tRNA 2-selenouridine synthase